MLFASPPSLPVSFLFVPFSFFPLSYSVLPWEGGGGGGGGGTHDWGVGRKGHWGGLPPQAGVYV